MAIIKIFYKTGVMLLCSGIQVIGVITEGVKLLSGKITDYLEIAHDWLVDRCDLNIWKKPDATK